MDKECRQVKITINGKQVPEAVQMGIVLGLIILFVVAMVLSYKLNAPRERYVYHLIVGDFAWECTSIWFTQDMTIRCHHRVGAAVEYRDFAGEATVKSRIAKEID